MGNRLWSFARNSAKDSTASDAPASLSHSPSRTNGLLDDAHQALSERRDHDNLLAGDDELKAKGRDIRAVLALEKAALALLLDGPQ